jgi:hypothetical protein
VAEFQGVAERHDVNIGLRIQANRLASATVESLLRWTRVGTTRGSRPCPMRGLGIFIRHTRSEWDETERKHGMDTEGWRRWSQSLNGSAGLRSKSIRLGTKKYAQCGLSLGQSPHKLHFPTFRPIVRLQIPSGSPLPGLICKRRFILQRIWSGNAAGRTKQSKLGLPRHVERELSLLKLTRLFLEDR